MKARSTATSPQRRRSLNSMQSKMTGGSSRKTLWRWRSPWLSRILPSSEILSGASDHPSDMKHLLLSDLVIVDEAHNFRSVSARRTAPSGRVKVSPCQ